MADVTYTMLRKGATTGAVSGRHRSWAPGQQIVAPRGEFTHLDPVTYRIEGQVETTTARPQREVTSTPGLTKHAKGGGWYEARRGDEVVFKKQDEAAVDAYIDEHEADAP